MTTIGGLTHPHPEVVATGPLTFGEQTAWQEFRTDPGTFFRRGAVLAVDLPAGLGPDDLGRLAQSACARHDILRTAFDTVGGVPTRTVLGGHQPPLLDGPPDDAPVTGRAHLLPQDLVHVWWGARPDGGVRLSFGLNEMITDPWSCARLRREVQAEAAGHGVDATGPTFAEHAREERDRTPTEQALRYWRDVVADGVPAGPVPDGPDPNGDRAGERIVVLPDPLTEAVRAVSRRHRMSPFMVVSTLAALAVARSGGVRDVAMTTMVSTRSRRWNDTLGNFGNVSLLRVRLPADPSLGEALAGTRHAVLGSLRHQPMPFALVQELAREEGRPLPDTSLRVHYLPAGAHHYGSSLDGRSSGEAWTEDVDFAGWPFDLGFAEDSRQRLAVWAAYDARRFRHAGVEGLIGACRELLGSLGDGGDPDRRGLV